MHRSGAPGGCALWVVILQMMYLALSCYDPRSAAGSGELPGEIKGPTEKIARLLLDVYG